MIHAPHTTPATPHEPQASVVVSFSNGNPCPNCEPGKQCITCFRKDAKGDASFLAPAALSQKMPGELTKECSL